jgi:hypothetical protein
MILSAHFWSLLEYFNNEYGCLWCSKRFEEPWVSVVEGRLMVSGVIAFHWSDSHGIDPETLEYILSAHFFKELA